MKRREFLQHSAMTAVGLGLSGPLLGPARAAGRARRASDRILVAVNLFGGNDGLNTVVPLADYDLYRGYRPTLALDRDGLLPLADAPDVAFNPALGPLAALYDEGRVAIVAGVGPPSDARGLFDHVASQEVFQTGQARASASAGRAGWIGRWLDSVEEGIVSPGVDFGGGPIVVSGLDREALGIDSIDEFRLRPVFDAEARLAAYERVMAIAPAGSPVAERVRALRARALEQSRVVLERTAGYEPGAEYPDPDVNFLSRALLECARLVAADVGVRALAVGLSGFDTHAGQNDGPSGGLGFHDQLLADVAGAVAAFHADLAAHGAADRVAVLVFSEFGRRPQENTAGGTDHGYGSVAMVVGGGVRGGLYGEYPRLAEDRLVLDGNLGVTVDYRSVYATILGGFLGADPEAVLGGAFPALGFF